MKKILLSFKPKWYEKISVGEKILEYRTRFCDEEVLAYMYVSRPIMAITGVIKLGRRTSLLELKNNYSCNSEEYEIINQRLIKNNYVMPILEFYKTNKIELIKIQKNISGFKAPQMYYNLHEDGELLDFIEKNIVIDKHKLTNEFSDDIVEYIRS